MKNIIFRIAAAWAAFVWIITISLVALILWLTSWMKEPGSTEFFRRVSVVWIRAFFILTGCPFSVKGKENFKKGQIYVVTCNHNSFIDVTILTPFVPWANKTIAKEELAKIPVFGLVYKRGSILVNRKDKESRKNSFLKMINVIHSGMHMCIYPEGTRNKTTLPISTFHDGAFRLAKETNKNVIPALIFNSKKVLPSDKGFWFRPGRLEIHFLQEVNSSRYNTSEELRDSVHKIMTDYFVAHQK